MQKDINKQESVEDTLRQVSSTGFIIYCKLETWQQEIAVNMLYRFLKSHLNQNIDVENQDILDILEEAKNGTIIDVNDDKSYIKSF